MRDYLEYIISGSYEVLFVDNTNTTLMDVSPYVAVAKALGVSQNDIEIITIWADPIVAYQRSRHVTELAKIMDQYQRLMKELTPSYWKNKMVVSYKDNTGH